ncbi:MAG: rolling circle replication-associated protein [Verrucomicrobiales bacterium]|jgi:hypothetical protein
MAKPYAIQPHTSKDDIVTFDVYGENLVRVSSGKGKPLYPNSPKGRYARKAGGWTTKSRRTNRHRLEFYKEDYKSMLTLGFPTNDCDALRNAQQNMVRFLRDKVKPIAGVDLKYHGVLEFKDRSTNHGGDPHFHIALNWIPNAEARTLIEDKWVQLSSGKGEIHWPSDHKSVPECIARYLAKSAQKHINPSWWDKSFRPWFSNQPKPRPAREVKMTRAEAEKLGLMDHILVHNGALKLQSNQLSPSEEPASSSFGETPHISPGADNEGSFIQSEKPDESSPNADIDHSDISITENPNHDILP